MIDGVTNAGSIPVLERLVQFAGQRHRVIVNNIANLDTPGFRPADVDVDAFQAALGEAVDERRDARGERRGELDLQSTREVGVGKSSLVLKPTPIGDNILFHDGNDRDPERIMQDMVENFMVFRTATDLLKSRMDLINTAIRARL